jgi:hypothetical protein
MAIKSLSKVFESTLKFFKAASEADIKALRGNGGGVNFEINEEGIDSVGPDRDKPEEYNSTFDRTSLLQDYRDARTFKGVGDKDNGIVSDVILVTRQHEFMSGLQRDYMARKMSRIQAIGLDAELATNMSKDDKSPLKKTLYGMLTRWFKYTGHVTLPKE